MNDTYDILKMLSSKTKLKIIVHFLHCDCEKNSVSDLINKFDLKQANLSKHLIDLKESGVLASSKRGKEIYYSINKDFHEKWEKLVKMMMEIDHELKHAVCDCHHQKQLILNN